MMNGHITTNLTTTTVEVQNASKIEITGEQPTYCYVVSGAGGGDIQPSSSLMVQTMEVGAKALALVSETVVNVVSEAIQGPSGPGVPAGGGVGDVLFKQTAQDYNTSWGKLNLATQVEGKLPFANVVSVATARLLGRRSAGTGDIEALIPQHVRDMLGFQHGLATAGENSIIQSIAASSSFLQTIALNSSDWTHGIMMIRDAGAGISAGAVIIFSTETNKAAGLSGAALSYVGNSPWAAGGRVRLSNFDGFITDTIFFNGTGGYDIRINSARINGNQIEINWFNTAVISRTVSARMRWFVWRGDQVNA